MIQELLQKLGLLEQKDEDCDKEEKQTFNDAIYEAKVAVAKAERDQWKKMFVPREANHEHR